MVALVRPLVCALVLAGCSRAEPIVPPPPLPEAPALPVAIAEPVAEPAPAVPHNNGPRAPRPAREPKSKTTGAAYVPPVAPAPPPPIAPIPVPAVRVPAPTPAPPKMKSRVTVPRTEHVHVELPSGLQDDLDADPRMQPWVERVIAIADSCHAQARGNTGAIEATITMHENDRPDADIRSVPAQLGGIVACATGALLRTKMPLFTGREGTRYPVRIVFN